MIDGCSRCDVDEACVFLLKHLRDRRTRNRIAGAQIRAQHLLQELGIFFPELCAAGDQVFPIPSCSVHRGMGQ